MTEFKNQREQEKSDNLNAVGRIFIRDGFNSIGNCGIPIGSDEGWERIENVINPLIRKLQSSEER